MDENEVRAKAAQQQQLDLIQFLLQKAMYWAGEAAVLKSKEKKEGE